MKLKSSEFTTYLYNKLTNMNSCILNSDSQCPKRYKIAVITNFVNRAYKNSSSQRIFLGELKHIKQRWVNNDFPSYIIDKQIKSFLQKIHNTHNKNTIPQNINIFYCNQMHNNYKQNEFAIGKSLNTISLQ